LVSTIWPSSSSVPTATTSHDITTATPPAYETVDCGMRGSCFVATRRARKR
jgi:hypothetical protein